MTAACAAALAACCDVAGDADADAGARVEACRIIFEAAGNPAVHALIASAS